MTESNKKIKYRAWNKRKKLYAYDVHKCYDDAPWGYVDDEGVYDSFGEICEDEGITIEQFTGLLDKNGKEIYEGDIIETKRYGARARVNVEWQSGGWCPLDEYSRSEDGWKNPVKIIGNIHESPKLVEYKTLLKRSKDD